MAGVERKVDGSMDDVSLTSMQTSPVLAGDYRKVFQHWPGTTSLGQGSWLWDTIITDPPFGARTHEGARTCAEHDTQGVVDFKAWTAKDVQEFVAWAVPRTRRWIVPMTSHDLIPAWEAAYDAAGWYRFAPVTVIIKGMGVRRQGDGPASWCVHLMPARARTREAMANPASNGTALWRALPGGYVWSRASTSAGQGLGKPVSGLLKLVRDYSNPGDRICDPFAGTGSTLIAALQMGRTAVGSEIRKRIAKDANKAIDVAMRPPAGKRGVEPQKEA